MEDLQYTILNNIFEKSIVQQSAISKNTLWNDTPRIGENQS